MAIFISSEMVSMSSMPPELLRRIFENLSYTDLKLCVPAVCKKFRSVLAYKAKFGAVDRMLFRDEPRAALITDAQRITVHPIFGMLLYDPTMTSIGDLIFLDDRSARPSETPALNENAVSPAVQSVVMHVAEYQPMVVQKPGAAVTVMDILNVLVQFGGQVGSLDVLACSVDVWEMARRRWWKGIESALVKDGVVHLFVLQDYRPREVSWM